MNSLSWMIYLADVCGNLGFPAFLMTLVGGLGSVISTSAKHSCAGSDSEDDKVVVRIATSTQKIAIPAAIIGLLLVVFVPSKDAVYAIAASEMGEDLLKAPEANKARQALNVWLDKQIGNNKPEK